MKITAVLESKNDTVQVTETFKRRVFTVTYWNNPEHTEYISFELLQDRCKILDSFEKGDTVVVSFNLKGRKWVNNEGVEKYFNTLQAWNIERDTEQHPFFSK
jgi:hypothetical protein